MILHKLIFFLDIYILDIVQIQLKIMKQSYCILFALVPHSVVVAGSTIFISKMPIYSQLYYQKYMDYM